MDILIGNQLLIDLSLEQGCSKQTQHMGVETNTGSFSLSCATGMCILPHGGISCSLWKISSKEACVGITS